MAWIPKYIDLTIYKRTTNLDYFSPHLNFFINLVT